MKALLLLLMGFISCVSVTDDAPPKDYSPKHTEALPYCKNKGFNQSYYFLVDLSVHSGRNRFYVYDFNQKKITDSGLVTHGSCDVADDNDTKFEKAKFSNADGSHCSSLVGAGLVCPDPTPTVSPLQSGTHCLQVPHLGLADG